MKPEANRRSFWPYGLIVTFAVFIAWLASFAVLAVRNGMDLERPDYYEQEIRYQEQIDRESRTAKLSRQIVVAYDASAASVRLRLPAEHARKLAQGVVKFYRPSDADLDREVPLQVDASGLQELDVARLPDGLWKLRISWRVDDEDFYADRSVVVKHPSS
jgi:nitrogen fixation protein FixH